MEILFFRVGKRIAGIATCYLAEVVHEPAAFPFLPVSPHIPEMIIRQGRPIGIIDIIHIAALDQKIENGEIIILNCEGITFGIRVTKMLQVRTVSQSRLVPAQNKTFIPDDYLECTCQVKTVSIPIISPVKILYSPGIKPLWSTDINTTPEKPVTQ